MDERTSYSVHVPESNTQHSVPSMHLLDLDTAHSMVDDTVYQQKPQWRTSSPYVHRLYQHATDPKRYDPKYRSLHSEATDERTPYNVPSVTDDKAQQSMHLLDLDPVQMVEDAIYRVDPVDHVAEASVAMELEAHRLPTATSFSNISSYLESMKILRDILNGHQYNQAMYLQMIDSLETRRASLPFQNLINVLADMLASDNHYFIHRTSTFILCQGNFTSGIEKNLFWDIISKSLGIVKMTISSSQVAKLQACKSTLTFAYTVFVKDLLQRLDNQSCAALPSIVEEVISLTSTWIWRNSFLNVAFSLLESKLLDTVALSEWLGVLFNLALLSLVTCKSKEQQEDCLVVIAKDISWRIDKLSTSFQKHQVLLRIPSDDVRLKVIDHHLDNYFASTPAEHGLESTQPFSLSKFRKVHLQKTVFRPNGTRQGLNYLLCLLTMLLQSYLMIEMGVPLLSFLPNQQTSTSGPSCQDLTQLHDLVIVLINRLSSDPSTSQDLIAPTNWYYLELLMTLTA